MKITNVEPIVLRAPVKEPWRIGTAVFASMNSVLVRVDTDEGITGYGECLVRFAPAAAAAIVEEILKPVAVGQDPFDVELIWDRMYQVMRGRGHSKGFMLEAMSGVDIALWDVMGKAVGQPVHRILGSYGRTTLPVYASSLLFKPTELLVREAEDLAARGYGAMKLKIGQGVEADLRNVREIQRVLGDGVKLMVDANCAFDVPVAPHTGASSAVEIAAAMQWAAALPNMLIFEWMYPPNPLREELLVEPLPPVKDGFVAVPEKPGLGIEVDEKALARFRVG